MQAQQVAMQTTSHNIANANVAGYSKETVQLAASNPENFAYGSVGTGVSIQGITRARDTLLDSQYRTAAGAGSSYQTTADVLGRIESVVKEPSDTGLSNAMDSFFNSFSDLANDPTSSTARAAVSSTGTALTTMFHSFTTQLDNVDASSRSALTGGVSTLNSLLDKVAMLNPAITAGDSNHRSANDLRDERDRALDQISQLTNSQVVEHNDGSVAVYVSGHLLVDRQSVNHVSVGGGTSVSLTVAGDPAGVMNVGGSIGGNLDAINVRIPTVRAGLDNLAGSIVTTVNGIHSSGVTFSGTPPVATAGGNFFAQNGAPGTGDPAQTARGIALDPSIANLANIVAAGASASGPGDNTVANALAGLRDSSVTIYDGSGATAATTSLGGYYRQVVTDLGLASSQATDLATAQKTLVNQSDSQRLSVSGVATDEELVSLIKQQQAYAAAARVITAVDEMSKTLLAITT